MPYTSSPSSRTLEALDLYTFLHTCWYEYQINGLLKSLPKSIKTSFLQFPLVYVEGTLIWQNLQVGISKSRADLQAFLTFQKCPMLIFFLLKIMIPSGYLAGTHRVWWDIYIYIRWKCLDPCEYFLSHKLRITHHICQHWGPQWQRADFRV